MPLWTDIIDPVEATAAARVELAEYERQNSLAKYLPTIGVDGDTVEVFSTDDGLVSEANFRAWNAPPEIGETQALTSTIVKLPAISRNEPIDEKTQRALKRLSEDRVKRSIEAAIRRNVWATGDALERTRGALIQTGKVANPWQKNFKLNEDFGRDAALTLDAGVSGYWSNADVDRIGQLQDWIALWKKYNTGQELGAILVSDQSFAGYARGKQFATLLPNGGSRTASKQDVMDISSAEGFAPFDIYNRSTKSGRVLDPKYIYLMPAPVAPDGDTPSLLGATYTGETLTADAAGFESVADGDPRGMVCGVYKEDRIPYTVEVMSDAVALPVAQKANAVLAVKVFA